MAINWNGDALKAKKIEAAKRAVDRTMSEAVIYAKQNHPGWKNITAAAEGSVQVAKFAEEENGRVGGLWGSQGVHYVIWLELKHGSFLRSAAAAVYPRLKTYLREAFQK